MSRKYTALCAKEHANLTNRIIIENVERAELNLGGCQQLYDTSAELAARLLGGALHEQHHVRSAANKHIATPTVKKHVGAVSSTTETRT